MKTLLKLIKSISALLVFFYMAGNAFAAEDYKFGTGDVVKITVYNNPDLSTEAQIAEDGAISFPLIGKTTIGGLSKNAAEAKIAQSLIDGGFLKQAQVNILVSQYKSQQVSVLGEVNKPGKYTIGTASTLIDLIALAGGVSPKGSQKITLIHTEQGQQIKQDFNLNSLFSSNSEANLPIANNDIVYVHPLPIFYIYGQVQKPGAYPLDSSITIRQAMSIGGGLTIRGTEKGLKVTRKDKDGVSNTLAVHPDDVVQEGDVIQVKESLF